MMKRPLPQTHRHAHGLPTIHVAGAVLFCVTVVVAGAACRRSTVLPEDEKPAAHTPAATVVVEHERELLGGWTLTINGHTDNIGGEAFNLDLSRRRSAAVRRALSERYKIDPARLTTGGLGASQPKENNSTIEGRAKNRRVELVRQ